MKKRIVICCDGTWNEPENISDKVKVPTNVLKAVRAISQLDEDDGVVQVMFYNEGVGTGSIGLADKMIGGGLGAGISANIQSTYRFLANNYVEGDDVFLFGFSRGAYTVRSLSGMLEAVGLLGKSDLRFVPEAYEYYQLEPEKRVKSKFHTLLTGLSCVKPKIKFLGVWDTVAALGVPTPILGRVQKWVGQYWRAVRVGFHHCGLCGNVENAYQALAIDERRGPFRPALWDSVTDQREVQQVWFAGVHSNVGGGYPDCGLSDVALKWMLNRAAECGLSLNEKFLQTRIDANEQGKLEDSYRTGYKLLNMLGAKSYQRVLGEQLSTGEMIHASVLQRICSNVDPAYRPVNVASEEDCKALTQQADFIEITGKKIPVCRERQEQERRLNARIPTGQAEGKISISGQPLESCQIIDFSAACGARLGVDHPVSVGSELHLSSPLTGDHDSVVVWANGSEAGIRFVA